MKKSSYFLGGNGVFAPACHLLIGMMIHVPGLAKDLEAWRETMTCGRVEYQLESMCIAATDEFTLNDCRSQSLTTVSGGASRKVTLPELSRSTSFGMKKAGRDQKDLFVTEWTCVQVGSENFALLYYSIGGGSAPYSDAMETYDTRGRLLEEQVPELPKIIKQSLGKMKSVRSIMPR